MSDAVIQSLDRGLLLLDAVAHADGPLGLAELAAVLDVDRSSAFRLANTLKRRGMLAQLPDTKEYVLGSAIWRIASRSRWGDVLGVFAAKQVAALAHATQETTHLAVREGRQAALIHHQMSEQPVGVSQGSGECVPLHCTSVGRALLMDYDLEGLKALLGNEPLPTFHRRAIASLADLAAECQRGRARGFALDDQEYNAGVRCIAAPVRDFSGEVVASIGISAPADRLPKRRIEEVAKIVIRSAKELGAQFGG